jgi:sporulation protein YlmC with PRC-barrel domain
MLRLSSTLLNQPVLSLRTGGQVAVTQSSIINPNNLKVEGFMCYDSMDKKLLILLYQDIRDVIAKGLVINDHEVLTEPSELVRLKDILELKFELIGKPVVTVSKSKLGKVNDYAVETETMYVQKLYVSQSILKSFSGGSLSVDRGQITEITNQKIVIQDILQGKSSKAPATVPAI